MKISIVVPTYNERENLPRLVKKVFEIAKKNKLNLNVIVVDDNSPDKTWEVAESLKKKYKVHVIRRKGKLGLGTAYTTGFKHALKIDSDVIFSMDADLSHDPKYILNFIKKLKNYDVVVGSRYIKGGGVVNWEWYRKIMSRYANMFARLMLNIGVNDLTTGYRCYKKNVLKTLNLNNIRSDGYSFLEEILYFCKKNGFRIGETPIVFFDRKYGKSKLSKIEMLKFFITVLRLRLK